MGPVSAEVEVDASREEAFALLADLSLRPSFTDHFLTDFRLLRIDPVGLGAGARFRIATPIRSPWADATIVELEEPFKLVERGRTGRTNRIETTTVWELTGGSGGLTKITVATWTQPTHPIDKAVEALSGADFFQRRGWREALRRLREILEGERELADRIAVAGGNRYATGIP
ncbi:MAG: SRPBCC family protein [Actinobacteria bacterium]|nr:SRPBCC family protein [Actinomycetota bacterium]